LSLDDADTLTYHQNKLKQAQKDLLKSQTTKKQDKLLANVACDYEDDGVTAGQNLSFMWNYLRKCKNNHAKNSLRPETCSNASTDARIWKSGPATLDPLNLHCYRFVLGHHLFNHKLSPYDEKEAKLIPSRHNSVQAQASTATPSTHPLFVLPFTLLEPTTQINKLFPDKPSGPSRSLIRCYKLEAGEAEFQSLLLLLFNGILLNMGIPRANYRLATLPHAAIDLQKP